MKNRNTILLILALCWLNSQAQVSLDSSEFPLIGTNYLLNNVAFVDVPPVSAPGPNESYDFTGGYVYGGILIDYTDAALSPFAANYPTSTLHRFIKGEIDTVNFWGSNQHHYYNRDASGFWQRGIVTVGYILDPPQTIDTIYYYFNAPNQDTLLTEQYTYGYVDSTTSILNLTILFGPDQYEVVSHIGKKINA
ncbi:MAG: hypothetical protein JKX73_10475, partial [Flavobacteriales bacterium]|nr:hypothetical protein [Flavobacteriales bacterium]